MISVNEALTLIFDDALKGDLEELSEEQDSVVDNDGPPSPKQRQLAVETSDSLPTDFMQIRAEHTA